MSLQLALRGYSPPAAVIGVLFQKREKAKEVLGENWVLHPNYKYQKRHGVEAWKSK